MEFYKTGQSPRGMVVCSPDGQCVNVQGDCVATDSANSGTSILVEKDGIKEGYLLKSLDEDDMEIYKPGFVFTPERVGVDGLVTPYASVHNIIPTVGLNYLLEVAFRSGSAYASWYLSLFNANRTPLVGDTMASFLSDCDENTAYTTTGNARSLITFPAASGGEFSTVSSPAVFDFTTSSTVRGAFITTGGTRGGTTGLLISAVLFDFAKTIGAGESLRVPLGFSFYTV